MVNLRFLNAAIGKVSSDEFAVLYVIANNPKLQREGRVRLYREQIADMVGWLNDKRPEYGLKKVTKVTNSLEENGWLKKDVVFETTQKSVNYYRLNTQKIGEKCTSSEQKIDEKLPTSTQKSIPLNKTIKEDKKRNKTNNNNNTDNSKELSDEEILAMLEEKKQNTELHYACSATNESDDELPF